MQNDACGLDWLSTWYQGRCNGEWEELHGVRIDTLDNPGWSITIDLDGTALAGKAFSEIKYNYEHEADWWLCRVRDGKFEGVGGPLHLKTLIDVFRVWVGS
ncbi:immunity 53 family protein [Aminobacter aminovorans]|uniref:immunity 53 family protein n=1 Tax=Aminobacter aminovorans TaxID=83263 RepID=UPI002861A10A|nr:immunity 53 family protein [Aminobacter aminovorans]MDR7219937.1 hypothetical protein [Aminobacter aminovorans]